MQQKIWKLHLLKKPFMGERIPLALPIYTQQRMRKLRFPKYVRMWENWLLWPNYIPSESCEL